MLWGRRAWLQIRITGCMPWCFLASFWLNVAFPVNINSLLLTRMRQKKRSTTCWCEYPVNHDWRAVPALREPEPQPLRQQKTDGMSWTADQPICACCKGVGHYTKVSLYQARLQGATNSSTVTILYILLDIAGERVHALLHTWAATSLLAEKKSNASQTGMSGITLAIRSDPNWPT